LGKGPHHSRNGSKGVGKMEWGVGRGKKVRRGVTRDTVTRRVDKNNNKREVGFGKNCPKGLRLGSGWGARVSI